MLLLFEVLFWLAVLCTLIWACVKIAEKINGDE
jgi:hypothetical protein